MRSSSFELSACQTRYKTIQEARVVDESYCDHFNSMSLYYENNADKIFIPKDAKNYASTEKRKATEALSYISKNNITGLNALIYNNTFKDNSTSHTREFVIANSILKSKAITYNYTRLITSFDGTPFDRDYIKVQLQTASNANPAQGPDCSKTFYSIKEALVVNPGIICNLNLAKQSLKNIPSEVYQFKNLQSHDLRGNQIPEDEINKLKPAFPK